MKTGFKTILRSAVLLVVSMTAAGCAKDDMPSQYSGELLPVLLGTGGEQAYASRTASDGNEWHLTDEIGVFVIFSEGTLPGDILSEGGTAADNVRHSVVPHNTDASKASFNTSNNEIMYYPKTGEVDIIAYRPHRAYRTRVGAIDDNCICSVDVRGQNTVERQVSLDMLYAKKTGVAGSEDVVDLEFDHVMSKVTLHVRAGDGISAADILAVGSTDVIFNGMPVTAMVALADGTSTAGTVNEQAVFSPLKAASAPDGYQASFTAIVVPQAANSYQGRTVTFRIGAGNYVMRIPDSNAFTAGNHYLYQVTVTRTGVVIGGYGIADWNLAPQEVGVFAPGIYTADDLVAFSAQWNATADIAAGQLRTEAQAAVIADWSDNGRADGVVRVRADIDMGGVANFDPIGSRDGSDGWPFTGIFDGGHFTVGNLKIDVGTDNLAGLFGFVSGGKVRNVILDKCDITGGGYVGGITGLVRDGGTIGECKVTEAKIVSGSQYSGGIAGVNNNGSISECSVSGSLVTAGQYSGGIAGLTGDNGTIGMCEVTGATVTASGNEAGGIVGFVRDKAAVSACGVTGVAVTADRNAGGIAGSNGNQSFSGGTIGGCRAEGITVTARINNAGGIVGVNYGGITRSCIVAGGYMTAGSGTAVGETRGTVGGIAGYNTVSGSQINDCRVNGVTVVSEADQAGGIVGYSSDRAVIRGCSATDAVVTAVQTNAGGIVGHISSNSVVSGCLVVGGAMKANQQAGGIAGQNTEGGIISGSIASPGSLTVNSGTGIGVVVGYMPTLGGIVSVCYWGQLTGLNAIGLGGLMTGGGSFNRTTFGNFFNTGLLGETPVVLMNAAILLNDPASPYRWRSGGAGEYPIIYMP